LGGRATAHARQLSESSAYNNVKTNSGLMLNSRSIPPEAWEHASEALFRYFANRHGYQEAEDMAQNTLLKVWEREDYEFENVSDFPKVCLGFARMISFENFRSGWKAQKPLDFEVPTPAHSGSSHRATESRIFLAEVRRAAASRLKPREQQALRDALVNEQAPDNSKLRAPIPPSDRIFLHRTRQKLRKITGWRKKN
jgi:DNA-directed RNA polymerase specialized sigma24 family protein